MNPGPDMVRAPSPPGWDSPQDCRVAPPCPDPDPGAVRSGPIHLTCSRRNSPLQVPTWINLCVHTINRAMVENPVYSGREETKFIVSGSSFQGIVLSCKYNPFALVHFNCFVHTNHFRAIVLVLKHFGCHRSRRSLATLDTTRRVGIGLIAHARVPPRKFYSYRHAELSPLSFCKIFFLDFSFDHSATYGLDAFRVWSGGGGQPRQIRL